MTPFRDWSLRRKLLVVILASTVLSLGLAFLFVVQNDIRTFKSDMVDQTVVVARVIGDYSVGDLAFEDRDQSAQTLGRLASIPHIEHAWLYDAHGVLFSSYTRPGVGQTPPPSPGPSGFRDGHLIVTQPILFKDEQYGNLLLQASTAPLDAKVRRHLVTMLSAMVLLILLSVLAALRLQRLISEPILALAETARAISESHDYSVRVPGSSSDEIGALRNGFNDMLAQIEKRQAEREEADQRTREKSQFLANMSHELRTPMNSIIGFSEILLGKLAVKISSRELKFLQNINNSGQHLLGIINDILDLSKVEAGRMEVHPERVLLPSVVDAVCGVMRGVSSKRQISFELDVPSDLPILEADPVRLKQVLYNLASNAVKFSPEGSTVWIRARALAAANSPLHIPSVELSVTDQGVGIDAKDHDLVFQEFRQAGGGARQVEGTGLGLALVKRFVELHDGQIALESAPGKGSTFTVTLPCSFRGAGEVDARAAAGGTGTRVLVVEDEPAAFKRLSQELSAAGYIPLWARSGEEAVSLARGLKPAAITLDVLLRGMDGWQVLRELKSDPDTRHIPVVMVTVFENEELGLALGADDYFMKPVDHEQLVRRLRALAPADAARVLLVDDDPTIHDVLDARLAAEGYTVQHALSGSDGVTMALASVPSLIVLDLMMDGMDGFETALRLKSNAATRNVPIVVLTGKDVTRNDRERLRGRIVGLIQKGHPVQGDLAASIRSLAGGH